MYGAEATARRRARADRGSGRHSPNSPTPAATSATNELVGTATRGVVRRGTVGRPSALTAELAGELAEVVARGNFLSVACRSLSVSVGTARKWMTRGRQERDAGIAATDSLHVLLVDAVEEAEARAEVAAVAVWRAAIGHDWRAAAAYLARRFPERWGPGRKVRPAEGSAEGSAEGRQVREVFLDLGGLRPRLGPWGGRRPRRRSPGSTCSATARRQMFSRLKFRRPRSILLM